MGAELKLRRLELPNSALRTIHQLTNAPIHQLIDV